MKILKKLLLLALCAALALPLAACGGEVTAKKSVDDIYVDITAAVELPSMLRLSAEDLYDFTGISASLYKQCVACVPSEATSGDMLFIFEAVDEDSAATLKTKTESFRQQKQNEMDGYIDAECAKIKAASVQSKGNFVWLVVSADSAEITEIIEDNIG